MDNNALILWKDLLQYWIQNYSSGTNTSMAHFLEQSQLFAPKALGIGLPLLHCVHKSTQEHDILISLPTAAQLANFISNRLHPIYPTPPLSIPFEMHLSRHDYYDIKVVTMADRGQYNKLNKQVNAANKRYRKLMDARMDWQHARDLVRGHQYVFVSLDIEAYESDHSILLEIGWTLFDSRCSLYLDQHYMMEPYRHLCNGKYVDDQRMRFGFGTSVWCTLDQALHELYKDLAWATQRDGGFVLVGHGLNSDLLYLKKCGFQWPTNNNRGLTDDVYHSALVTIINTDTLYGASIGDVHNPPSLGKCLALMDIEHWHLHNAGNDAHYTMELMMKLVDMHME